MTTVTRKKKKKKKLNKKQLFRTIFNTVICLGFITIISGICILFTFLNDKPIASADDFNSKQSSQIFDVNGDLIADVGETIRTNITYEQLPNSLIDAFISVEDSRFFEHNGFDIPRFSKAAINNLLSGSLSEGGSTFTMQLVDNVYFLDTNNTVGNIEKIKRKVQEIFLSMDVENVINNKKEIMERYLNMINFGGQGNIRGVQKASEYYFNKDVSDLSISESALLAGVINAPTYYNPFNYLDRATERRNTVLYLMNYHGYITDTEYTLAKAVKVEDILVDPTKRGKVGEGKQYQAYVDTVISEILETTGYDPTVTPMKIYTYMDPYVQKQIDLLQNEQIEGIEYPDELIELAVISLENKTGRINAIGGGRHYSNGGSLLLNYATEQYRQPGSTVKPFLSYAMAFEKLGWSTSHTVIDRPINYRGTNFVVKNYTGEYYGEIPLNYAIGNSLNTPAIQTLQDVIDNSSVQDVVDHLNKLGFDSVTKDTFDLGYAIGGSTFEATVEQIAAAMSTMLNGGYYNTPHTVDYIELIETGERIEQTHNSQQVISEESAYLVSQLMHEVIHGPYYNYTQILKDDYATYAKTGTTDWGKLGQQYGIPNYSAKDIWMIGGTSEHTVATWYGYPKAIKGKNTWISQDKNLPNIRGKITNLILDANYHNRDNPKPIQRPRNVSSITHVKSIYPYTSPIEGMDENYVTSGYINSKYYSLKNPLEVDINQLPDVNVSISPEGVAKVEFPVYPDESKLTIAPEDIDISLSLGDLYVEAYGKRLFDWSWVYGPIKYRVDTKVNGTSLLASNHDSNNVEYTIDGLSPGDAIEVCASYKFELQPIESNVVCKQFSVEDDDVIINFPQLTETIENIKVWGEQTALTITYNTKRNNSKAGQSEIVMIDPIGTRNLVNGKSESRKQSIWSKTTIEITTYINECPQFSTENGSGACICDHTGGLPDQSTNLCPAAPVVTETPDLETT